MIDVSSDFPGVADVAYLNTATMALGNTRATEALSVALDEWRRGSFDWVAAERAGEDVRAAVAGLLGVDAAMVALVAGASGGASTVAAQLPHASGGDNVVVPARDFASNVVPWLGLSARGYDVRLIDDDAGVLAPDAFAAAIDERTRVVATSVVQSATGFRVDLDSLRDLTSGHATWLVVDASQALGCMDLSVEGITALFSCGHKWTLGTRGIGYLYVDPAISESFVPISPGWKAADEPTSSFYGPDITLSPTASRLDVSWPWFNPIADREGIRIIAETGISTIEHHNQSLIDQLEAAGFILPFDRRQRSSITSIAVDRPDDAAAALAAASVVASLRAGRLRISVHLYNTTDDIDTLVSVLRGLR